MSDYLTRAVESVRPGQAAIRPRLPTVFEPEAASSALTFVPTAPRETVERISETEAPPSLRERISAITEIATNPQPAPITSPIAATKPPIPAPKPGEPPTEIVREKAATVSVSSSPFIPRQERAETQQIYQQPKPPPVTVLPRVAPPRLVPREQVKSEPPAIHVTIGRIEVRATAPAAPPTPKPRQPNMPRLSLDDYLRQRNRGRR